MTTKITISMLELRLGIALTTEKILDAREHRCDPGCLGWFQSDDHIEICDECARAGGYADVVLDSDVETMVGELGLWGRA